MRSEFECKGGAPAAAHRPGSMRIVRPGTGIGVLRRMLIDRLAVVANQSTQPVGRCGSLHRRAQFEIIFWAWARIASNVKSKTVSSTSSMRLPFSESSWNSGAVRALFVSLRGPPPPSPENTP